MISHASSPSFPPNPLQNQPVRLSAPRADAADNPDADRPADSTRLPADSTRLFLAFSSDAIFVCDPVGCCLAVNPRASQLLRRAPADLAGRPLSELVPRDELPRLEVLAAALPGHPRATELHLRKGDGSFAEVELTGHVLPDGRHVLVARDLGPRQQVERALRESEQRFRAAFRHAPAGMCMLDLHGHFRHANAAFCQLVGYSEDDLRGRSFAELTAEDSRAADLAAVRELREGQREVYQTRKRYIHKDGHLIWAQLSAVLVRGAAGQPLHTIAQVLDISQQVRVERALRVLAEATLRMTTSLDAHVTAAALAELLVPELADLCRVSLLGPSGLVVSETLKTAVPEHAELQRRLSGPCPYDPARYGPLAITLAAARAVPLVVTEASLRALLLDAEQLSVARSMGLLHCVGVPLRARGRTVGTLILCRCVKSGRFMDDEIRLIEELAQRAALSLDNDRLYQEAQQAIGARDRVLRVVAHDLRNPLNTINLATGQMLRGDGLTHDQQLLLERVSRSVWRANRMIGDLLDAAQIAVGKLRVSPTRQRPAELIQAAVEAHRMLLEDHALTLRRDIAEDLPEVLADRDRFQQVIGNLLGNAVKFTPSGGQVTVSARAVGAEVRVTVSDSGPGIPAAEQAHLFAPFWRAHPEERGGAGLGLSIARGLIEAQGGRIWYADAPGGGAAFSFTLPAAP